MRQVRLRLALLTAAVCAIGLAAYGVWPRSVAVQASPSALAARDFTPYLHRASTGALADPINLIFADGTPRQAALAVTRVLGWTTVHGSGMTFVDGGARHSTGWQLGTSLAGGARLHLRIEGDTNPHGGGYELAGVHHDTPSGCGHIGGDFSATRDLVAQAFAARGYTVTYIAMDNTQASRQCDGSSAGGDGQVALIDLASGLLPPQPPAVPVGRDFADGSSTRP